MNVTTRAGKHGAASPGDIAALERRVRVLEQELTALRAAVASLQDLERCRDLLLNRYGAVEMPALSRSCQVQAQEFIDHGSGFHGLEYGDQHAAYRWTGPEKAARLTFWLDRSQPVLVRVGISSFGANAPDAPVTLEVDGVPYTATYDAGGQCLVAGPVAPATHAGPTELVIHTPAMFSPADQGQSDTRVLGLAVNRIELIPG